MAQRSTVEIYGRPGLMYAISHSADEGNNLDSIRSLNDRKLTLSAGFLVNLSLKTNLILQTGIAYDRYVVSRYRENLQFLDVVHPQVGRIFDLSQGASKNVRYDQRFEMLSLPINLHYVITPSKRRNTYTQSVFAGITPQVLMGDQMRVDMEGFGIRGESEYIFRDSLLMARPVNVTFHAGFRHQFVIDQQLWVSVQPGLAIPLLTLSTSPVSDRVFCAYLQLGLNRVF